MSELDELLENNSHMVTAEADSKTFLISLKDMASVTTLITECSECEETLPNPLIVTIVLKDSDIDDGIEENEKSYVICNDCKDVLEEN